MGTNYIAPIWRMPENANKDKFSNYSINAASPSVMSISNPTQVGITSSFSFWLKRPSKTYATRIYNVGTTKQYGWYMYEGASFIRYNGNYLWPKDNPIGTLPEFRAATEIEDEWVHWVITRKEVSATGQDVRIYANGALVYSKDNTTVLGTSDSTLSSLLTRANPSNDNLSSFSVYDYELQLSQVQQIYNNGTPLNEMALSYDDPVSYYLLGDNANLNVGNTGVAIPNISVGADSVFDFDGAIGGALINVGNDSSLNITGSLSVSAWFKTLNNSDTIMIATKDNGGASRAWQLYMHTTGAIRFGINGVTGIAVSSGVYDDGNWHHVLGVYEPSNYIKLYIDGLADGEDTTSVPASINSLPSQDVVIGGYDGYDAAGGRRWDGELSNIQIWDTDLQLSDAETLYNNGQPLTTGTQPQAANLQAWWKLNQTANWEADSVGNWQIPDATSAFTQSFNFIAANSDYIDAGNLDELKNITELSVSLWFNYDSILTSADGLVARDASTRVDGNWYVALDSNNSIRFLLKTANGQDALNSSTISADRWYHTLCVWTGDVMKIYLNGDLDNSITLSNATGTLGSASDIVAIGRRFASSGFLNGKASNVALWSSDQSSQVSNIYNNGTPATSYTNTPQYWYKLDNTAVWNPAPANYWSFPNAGIQVDSGTFNFSN